MASRNHYTYTPGYQGGVRQAPSRAMDAYQDPYPRQNAYPRGVRRTSAQAARPTGDTLILALLFIVAPLCGILGIFVKTFLWIFIAVTFLVLAAMWALRCFEPRGRAFLSGILAVLAVVAFISTIDTAPRQRAFQTYGGNDQTLPAGQTGSSNAQNVQNSQGNGQSGQDSRGSQSNPNNIGFAGLPGMSPTPTAPIGPPEAGGAEYAQTGPEGEGWQAD
ncbi:MAG: hypothetical protein FWF69_03745, partial [Firmicutes bacterium]|nr:hypothetical protein [Bacillota bacterium]